MSFQVITDYAEALSFLEKYPRHQRLVKTWVPKSHFIELLHNEAGISVSREDDGIFAFALGDKSPVRADWQKISFERTSKWLSNAVALDMTEWEAHYISINPKPLYGLTKRLKDNEIADFLKVNAPDSSVFPGSDEIVHWTSLYDGEHLVGVGAICRWQSGEYVIASVATDIDSRGKGFGKKLMELMKSDLSNLGISEVCLGVLSENSAAKKVYELVGFNELFKLTFVPNFEN
jgi:ribosomal protein S18 acetylase RimI-like enzyme